jgi:GMP synthase (glutamine-hydrolysing)
MRILAVIYHDLCGAGVFGDEAVSLGHAFEQWLPTDGPPPRRVSDYDAVIAFGGGMQADEDELYPWLAPAIDVLAEAIDRRVPTLGLCLGGQMLARACGGVIGPAERAEWGFDEVQLTAAAAQDPLFARQPARLRVYQWHSYSFALPPNAVALARSPVCLQAFRVGDRAWGLQWHPEVTGETAMQWAATAVPASGGVPVEIDLTRLQADVGSQMQQANREGRALCRKFLALAEKAPAR